MTQQHPITPPPKLVQQWWEEADQYKDDPKTYFDHVATEAARWGADQELEACCALLAQERVYGACTDAAIHDIRATRRPKPPSLKEQALEALAAIHAGEVVPRNGAQIDAIRRALEALPND